MKNVKHKRGSTLVECLVVIGLIALLISIPAFQYARDQQQQRISHPLHPHGPVNTATHMWVFEGYGQWSGDTFAADLAAWLTEHPNYKLVTQNATDFDDRGRPQKYVVTIDEGVPGSIEK